MRRLLLLAASLIGLTAGAQNTLQRAVEQMAGKPALKGALVGVSIRKADGTRLASLNAGVRMTPASNLKLITTGTAIHAFGADHHFRTTLAYTGEIKDGALEGDLYIIGGGDPTIGAKDTTALQSGALFWKWKTLLRKAGIQRIHGRVIGDGSAYEGLLEHASWSYDDVGTYYGTGINALCFYENAIDFQVSAGAAAGDPVNIRQSFPETPWLHFINYAFTGPSGTGNSLYLYTTDLAPYAEMRGTFATDRRPKVEHFSNKYGDLSCAYAFWKNLKDAGWEVTGGYARIDRSGYITGPDFVPGEKPAARPVSIGFTESPELSRMAARTNYESDNFYAESFYRAMGEAASGNACYDSCKVAVIEVLKGLGLSSENGLSQADGSGLSRKNLVSPEWMTSFLVAMQKSPSFDAFLSSIPAPGDGTLNILKIEGGGSLRLKSGSMEGVLCYSGYVLDASGKPDKVVAIFTNGVTAPNSQVRAAIAALLTSLLQ